MSFHSLIYREIKKHIRLYGTADYLIMPMKRENKVVSDLSLRIVESILQAREQHKKLIQQLESYWENILPQIQEASKLVERIRVCLPRYIRQASRAAASEGWYLSEELDVPALRSIPELRSDELNRVMESYWRSWLSEAERRILDRHPARKKVLSKAFQAHRAGDHELSIPVFLAQADGICQEVTGAQLYSRRKSDGEPRIVEYIDGIEHFSRIFMEPLRIPMPINWNRNERLERPDILNRHTVLHGESYDYGTEINSLKAVSLLYFVGWVLTQSRAADKA